MSSHRGRRRTTTFGKSVIAFSSKQGQPVRPKPFLKIMIRLRLPADPYEGQIFYEPEHELIFEYKNGEWIDITDEELVY